MSAWKEEEKSPKTPISLEKSPKIQENSVYNQAIIERKLASFEKLKKWDNQRSQSLDIHEKFVELTLNKLEQKARISLEFMQKIIRFFKAKVQQEAQYSRFFQDFKEDLTFFPISAENPQIFEEMPQSFRDLDEMHARKARKSHDFVEFLEKTLLKDVLLKENSEFSWKVAQFRDQIHEIRKVLRHKNIETAEKSTKYSKIFHESTGNSPNFQQSSHKTSRNIKDLLQAELSFLETASEQTEIQRKLGEKVAFFWKELTKLEISREIAVQKAMLNYILQSEGLNGPAKRSFQEFEPEKYVKHAFSLGLFAKDELISLKIPAFRDENEAFAYLQGLKTEKFEEEHLILKEMRVEREQKSGSVKEFRKCWIVFTIDDNLLIFDEKPAEIAQNAGKYGNIADFCVRIDGVCVNSKGNPEKQENLVEIVAKEKGLFFDSRNKYVFRMENRDKVEEFASYFRFVSEKTGNF